MIGRGSTPFSGSDTTRPDERPNMSTRLKRMETKRAIGGPYLSRRAAFYIIRRYVNIGARTNGRRPQDWYSTAAAWSVPAPTGRFFGDDTHRVKNLRGAERERLDLLGQQGLDILSDVVVHPAFEPVLSRQSVQLP